ncbi:MAG: hypothetical protein LAP87_10635 [Acidobacteriia bacterium]|nr:hypothetical protein [Terriglobia bacterium]
MLALAAAEGRILVTSDLKTMPRHFGEFLEAAGSHAGVFLVKQHTPVADVVEARYGSGISRIRFFHSSASEAAQTSSRSNVWPNSWVPSLTRRSRSRPPRAGHAVELLVQQAPSSWASPNTKVRAGT